MKKEKFYRIIIIALLLLNFGVLAFLWIGKSDRHMPPPHQEPAGFIIERLQLDAEQRDKFQLLRDAHHSKAVNLREESKALHDALFNTLKNDKAGNHTIDSLTALIAKNDSAKEYLNYNHFKELKTILKPEQYKLYDEFITDIARKFGPPGPPRDGRPPRD